MSGGLTPCWQLRPSSRREHVKASNETRRKPTTGRQSPTLPAGVRTARPDLLGGDDWASRDAIGGGAATLLGGATDSASIWSILRGGSRDMYAYRSRL